jgi:thioredoxin-like negative regulator of GroEL
LPVVDQFAAEYSDRVDFVAPAWKSSFELTEARAEELFVSGEIKWGLDADETIFALYGVPYQPVTVLIAADQTVVDSWPGIRSEDEIREALDNLIDLTG